MADEKDDSKNLDLKMLTTKLLKDFEKARRAGVPLLVINTQDQMETMRQITRIYKDVCPIVRYDAATGLTSLNDEGSDSLKQARQSVQAAQQLDPTPADPPYEHVKVGAFFKRYTIFFVLNGHLFMGDGSFNHAAFGQALWNLRDKYKQAKQERIVVVLGPDVRLPEELKQDFVIFDDPLPETDELWAITKSIHESADVPLPTDTATKDKITQTLKGLSAFAAEQTLALSITKKGIDHEKLFTQKRKQIEATPGLSILREKYTFKDLRGCVTYKQFLTDIFNGNKRPTVIVFMDEVEKMFGGITGDNTGASQDQLGEFLRWSQDNRIPALMEVGHPGCSKSFIAKCAAGEFDVPMVEFNISAMKGSLLGQTGEQTRAAFRTVLAIGDPILFLTSNSMAILPPEFKRRCKLGTWFFDLPSDEEKRAIWDLYMQKYKLPSQPLPNDTNWTPAEIEVACEIAWRINKPLSEAAKFVVPVAVSDPEKVRMLREVADRRFNSVSHPGPYMYQKIKEMDQDITERAQRAINLSGKVGEA